ncbi:MAG: phage portal protein [Microterricola sp.]
MAIDTTIRNSPGWWLQKGARKLEYRQKRLTKLSLYHDGNPPLPSGAEASKGAFNDFQKKARTNFAELIVGAVRERLAVRSIRTAVDTDGNGDDVAWGIYVENNLDIELSDVLENMLALGDGYTITGLDPEDPERVIITGEDPRQVVTIHNPVRQSEVRAAVKIFHDADEQKDYAFLYLAGGTRQAADEEGFPLFDEAGRRVMEDFNARRYVASRDRKARARALTFSAGSFDWDDDFGGAEGEELGHKVVPVVRFRNRRGIGEFEPHIDLLDRINHTILQRMVIAAYQAFKQRALQVDDEDMPDEDEDGNAIDYDDLLTADPGSFIKIPKNATIWESGQADMQGILSSIKDDVQHLAAVTRTPMSVVSPDAVNQSAEGAALIKEGQVFKTEDKQKRAAAALRLMFHIAFLCLGDTERADKQKIIIDWAPAERHSLQQKYDAASKAPASIPSETIMTEILQFSPETVALAKSQQMDDALRGALSGQPTAPAPAANAG